MITSWPRRSAGTNGSGAASITFAIAENSWGAAIGPGDEGASMVPGVAGSIRRPPDTLHLDRSFVHFKRRTDGIFVVRSTRCPTVGQRQSDRPVGARTDLRGVRGELGGERLGRDRAHGSVEVLADDDPRVWLRTTVMINVHAAWRC
jgi:hypothetical protein